MPSSIHRCTDNHASTVDTLGCNRACKRRMLPPYVVAVRSALRAEGVDACWIAYAPFGGVSYQNCLGA